MSEEKLADKISSRKGNRIHNGARWPFYELTEKGNSFTYECEYGEDVHKARLRLAALSNYHNKKRDDDLRYVVRKEKMTDESFLPILHDIEGVEAQIIRFHVILVESKHLIYNKNDKDSNETQ